MSLYFLVYCCPSSCIRGGGGGIPAVLSGGTGADEHTNHNTTQGRSESLNLGSHRLIRRYVYPTGFMYCIYVRMHLTIFV